jgi:hypothetical protein
MKLSVLQIMCGLFVVCWMTFPFYLHHIGGWTDRGRAYHLAFSLSGGVAAVAIAIVAEPFWKRRAVKDKEM